MANEMRLKNPTALLCYFFLFSTYSFASDYYCNPSTGHASNDGSFESPWGSLQTVFATGKIFMPGDIVYLMSGHHGSPTIKGNNLGYVTIKPMEGQNPTIESIVLVGAKKWNLNGLTISPETAPVFKKQKLIYLDKNSTDNIIDSCFIYTTSNSLVWSEADWANKACPAIEIAGAKNNLIRNCNIKNIKFGIIIGKGADSCLIEHNIIENYMDDAIRGLADYCIFQYNIVKTALYIDKNHDDGFQSWSLGPEKGPDGNYVGTGAVYGVILRGNTFIDIADASRPFVNYRSNNHGIGCYGGMFVDWIVENNVVINNASEGIIFFGAVNCKIINNTVIGSPFNLISNSPNRYAGIDVHTVQKRFLGIGPYGGLSKRNTLRNNLVTSITNRSRIGVDFDDHNIEIVDSAAYFMDYENFDFHLRYGSPAIGAGSPDQAPSIDIEGNTRPAGNGFDVGAYEYVSDPGTSPDVNETIIK